MLTIDDFVMLGKTVPEPNADGRIFVCSAGVSQLLRRLVRIYPLSRYGAPPRWSTSTVTLEANPKDHRRESYRLPGDRSRSAHDHINTAFAVTGEVHPTQRAKLLQPYVLGSIKEANGKRRSLAVLHPDGLELDFEHNPQSPDSPELRLFDLGPRPTSGAKRFAYVPKLRFRDADGTHHLTLRDWGCFEFLRKHGGGARHQLPGALHLDQACSLLVGNMNHQRTAWLVISVLRGLRVEPTLLDAELSAELPAEVGTG